MKINLCNTIGQRQTLSVDDGAGVIYGVSVIQTGPALGHGFEVDAKMLKQVASQINAKPKGVKARLTHPLGHDGILTMIGRVTNAAVRGDKVRADLELGEYAANSPQGDLRAFVLGLAHDAPDLIGMSIVFEPGEYETEVVKEPRPEAHPSREERGKFIVRYGRSKNVLAVDLVGDPAANADGFLSNHQSHQSQLIALACRVATHKEIRMPITLVKDNNTESFSQGASDAILLRAGARIAEPHERHREFSGRSLATVARQCAKNRGLDTDMLSDADILKLSLNRREYARALDAASLGHSTSDFDSILENAAAKSLQLSYGLAPRTWSAWARKVTVRDFKQVSVAQLGGAAELLAIAEHGEYQFSTVTDLKQTYTLGKYGRAFSISWEALINDELSAFSRIPTAMGQAARRLEDTLTYSTIFAANSGNGQTMGEDSLSLFASGHANTGSSAVLSVASIGEAQELMRKQKAPGSDDANNGGDFLNIHAKYLLVPPALEITATQLTASAVDPVTNNATPNPFVSRITVVSEPRLSAVDANGWYVVADPGSIDSAHVAFLESEQNPVIEEGDAFTSDARRYKVRHSVAVAAVDYRAFVKNAGGS